jgi:uncharacterized protein (DUF1800 family)
MNASRFALPLLALLLAAGAHAAPAATPEQQAVHVLNRLAYGPKPGDIERVKKIGVQRYIAAQLDPDLDSPDMQYSPALSERLGALEMGSRSAGAAFSHFTLLQLAARAEEEGAVRQRREEYARMTLETNSARVLRAIDSPRQLEEVMVDFWFNHFNVFDGKGPDRALIASYERDAIRPYVFGSFRTMLGATAKHPAMLYYLDNYISSGQATNANGRQRGLNENYARELMELHTLGVNGGYSQADVTDLARMLTGWTYDRRALAVRNVGFRFDPQRHDNGSKLWLGRAINGNGQNEGEMALDVLAVHPSTARHISYKLAQYFVQDQPPQALVERMAKRWVESNGDIRSVLRTLFTSDEFMAPEAMGAKFKTPYQYVISAARASAVPTTNITPLLAAMSQLGMPLYGCATPDGYKNTQEAWLNPDALSRRIGFATALAGGKLPLAGAPPALPQQIARQIEKSVTNPVPSAPVLAADEVQAALGAAISDATRKLVMESSEPLRAALLLGSPDFMQH